MSTYTLVGPKQLTGENYETYQLFEHVGGIFGDGPREFATAEIHVNSEMAAICIPRVVQGVRATNLEHAIEFCKGMLGITNLLTSDDR